MSCLDQIYFMNKLNGNSTFLIFGDCSKTKKLCYDGYKNIKFYHRKSFTPNKLFKVKIQFKYLQFI